MVARNVSEGLRSIRPRVDPPRIDPQLRPKRGRSVPFSGTFHVPPLLLGRSAPTLHRPKYKLHCCVEKLCPVGLKIEIHEIHQNLRNPMCIINNNPPSATKSICMKRKLSKSNVSRHENEKLQRNPVLLMKSTHSHAFSREHSTRILRRLKSHQQSMTPSSAFCFLDFSRVSRCVQRSHVLYETA